MEEDSLAVVFNNYDTEDFQGYQFRSVLDGVLYQNPGADIFYDLKPESEAEKAQVEAYMAEAFEHGIVYGELSEYEDHSLLHTAQVVSEPGLEVGSFDAGPVVEDAEVDEFLEGIEGQEIPEDLGYGTSMNDLRDRRDEEFAEHVIDNAVNLEDTVVIKSVPTAVTLKFEREEVPVHRANDQLVSQRELQEISTYHNDDL